MTTAEVLVGIDVSKARLDAAVGSAGELFAVDNDARGIAGTYHNVSKKYLPLYLAEFSFRFNNRHNPDIFGSAIAGC